MKITTAILCCIQLFWGFSQETQAVLSYKIHSAAFDANSEFCVSVPEDFRKVDSLQKQADACSRSGQNYRAAQLQDHVDLLLMNAGKLRDQSLYRLAQAYIRSLQYDLAFYNITMLLQSKSKAGDNLGIADCYSVMAQVYLYKKNYERAGYYNRKALLLFSKTPHRKGAAATAKVLAANFFIERKNYPQALELLVDALGETTEKGFYDSRAYIKDRIGFCYFRQHETDKAQRYYLAALGAVKANPYTDIQMSVLRHLGELYLSQENFPRALYWLEACLNLKPPGEESEEYMLANTSLAQLYEATGRYEQAYECRMEAVTAQRALMDITMLTGTEALSTKFDAEQLYLQNRLLETAAETKRITAEQADARKSLYLFVTIFIGIISVTALLFLYFYFRQKKAVATSRNNELKQKLLLTQMNPHFIFNSVDTIQSLIYEDKQAEAVEYLSRFSELTLQILENSARQYISLREEMSMTANYLAIQQLLYDHSFEFHITTADSIQPETMYIPPMLTQPFIENAIKHGLAGKKEQGRISVRFYKQGKELFFEVEDNGRGLTSQPKEGHRSMSTGITSERLNAVKGRKVDIEVSTILKNGVAKGAVSRFAIPYKIKSKSA